MLLIKIAEKVEKVSTENVGPRIPRLSNDQNFSSPFVWTLPANIGLRVVNDFMLELSQSS